MSNIDRCPCGADVTVSHTASDFWEGKCEAGHVVRWVELFEPPVIVEAT